MEELRSAFDIAMDRARRLGEALPEEVKRRDLVPEGERLAARYLRGECSLTAELGKYDDEARGYVADGVEEVLLRNIDLPRSETARGINRGAMEGLKGLKLLALGNTLTTASGRQGLQEALPKTDVQVEEGVILRRILE